MATRASLLLLVLLALLRGTAAVDITPVDGCVLFDTTSWQISVVPSDAPVQDLAGLTDGAYGTACGFEVAAVGGDFDIIYDMGQTIYPYVETLAVTTYFWYTTKMPTWSVYTSDDLVQWTLHGTSTNGNSGTNKIDTIGVGPVALRYIQLQYRGGYSTYHHGRPAFRELAFSNCGAATNTTTTTSTATSSTATTSTATSSTATTSTATTSTATTTTSTTSTVTTLTVTTSSTTTTTETSSTSTLTTTTSTTSTTSTSTSMTPTTRTTSSSSTSTTTATTSTSSSTSTSTSSLTVTSMTTSTSSSSSATLTTSTTTSWTSTSTSSLTTTATSSSTSYSSTTTTTATTSSTSSSTASSTTTTTSSTLNSSSTSSSSTTVTTSTRSTTSSTTTRSSTSTTSLSSTTTATSSSTSSNSSSTATQTTSSTSSSTTSRSTTPTTSSTTASTSSSTATRTTGSTSSTATSPSTRTTTSSTSSSTSSSTFTQTTSTSSATSFSSTTSATRSTTASTSSSSSTSSTPTASSTASLSSTTTATNSTSTSTTSMSTSTSTNTTTTTIFTTTPSTSLLSAPTTSTPTTANTATSATTTTSTTASHTGIGIGTGTGSSTGTDVGGTTTSVTVTATGTATASAALLSAVTAVASPAQRAAELIDQVEQVLSTPKVADFYLETERDENTTTARWETSAGVAQLFAVENLQMQGSTSWPQDLEVQVDAAEMLVQVTLPAALVAAHSGYTSTPTSGNRSLALLVNVFNATGIQGLETTQETAEGSVFKQEVRALISIDLVYLFEGGSQHVDVPKTNPIRFSFGINDTAGLECSYWDETHLEWSTAGVTKAVPTDLEFEPFTCETTHLSLFAAIWSGLVSSADCSQISLLTLEAVQQLFETAGEWATLIGSLFSWGMLLMLLVTFGFASLVDMTRSKANTWGSDFFLVAEEPAREESEPELEDELVEDPTEGTSCRMRCLGRLQSAWYTCTGCCSACLGNSAFRDAIDDIASSWCVYFSDIRTILEELCSAADSESGGLMNANCHVLSVRLASHLLIAAVRRQAAAALKVSPDLINFVMEDEELTRFLTEGQEPTTRTRGPIQSSLTTVADLKAKAATKAAAKAARAAERAAPAEGVEDVPSRGPVLDCPQAEGAAVDDEDLCPATRKAGSKRHVTIEESLDLEASTRQALRNRRTALVTLLSQEQPPRPTLRSGWSAQMQGEDIAALAPQSSIEGLARGSRSATPRTPSTPNSSAWGFATTSSSAWGFATTLTSLLSLRRTSSTGRSMMSAKPSLGVLGKHLNWRETPDKWEAWFVLHHEISEALNQQSLRYVKRIGLGGVRHLRGIIWELFFSRNPWGSTFSFNPFMSCKMRALFFALDILGALALSILFFEASGTVGGKRGVAKNGSCQRDAEFSGSLGFKLGRLMAVAIGSTFCAGLPIAILTSLHTRDIRSLDQEGSKRWKKQLRAWAIQDRIIWVLGSLYCVFCTFYLVVFLSHISETDQRDFTVSLVMVLAQVCVIIPLVISIASPSLAWFSLSVAELIGARRREELIRQVNQRLHDEFNIMLPLLHI